MKYFLCLFFFIFSFSIESKSSTIESIINFGDSQTLNGNYLLAIHEYQRAFFFAGSEHKLGLSKKIADCSFVLGDFKLARTFYDSAIHYSKHDGLRIEYTFQKILCFMMENNFGYALLKLDNLEVGTDLHLQRRKNLYQGICYFGIEQYSESHQHFLNSISQTDTIRIFQLEQLYANQKKLKRPNSNTAMMLSIIVPGTGQAYSGDVKDGLNSFLLLGGLFYLGATSSSVVTIIVIPFFYRYYMGGIINAKQAAEKRRKEKQYYYYTNLMEVLLN